MHRGVSALVVTVAVAALAGAAFLASRGHEGAGAPAAVQTAAGWQGLLGVRPVPQLGDRDIVVLRTPSLADRLRAAGGVASEEQERAWTRDAERAQQQLLSRLATIGVPIEPEQRYVRIFNGFSAALDAGTVAALEREPSVEGVYPVRASFPAALGDGSALTGAPATPDVALAGFGGRGVVVALLDTGIDVAHPYLQGKLLPGIDVLDPTAGAVAKQNPLAPASFESHATELAGLVAGVNGPDGVRGVAPGASILPIRVAGWQPDVTGGVAVYGRTDQLLAGLEAAVDPDGNGDAHDAARIALVGVVEPDAAFADGPLALATAGAQALDTLVVAPAGNDGPAGPSYGVVGGPGGTPAALTVAAEDERSVAPTAHVLIRSGLDVLLDGEQPLGGPPPSGSRTTRVVAASSAPGQGLVYFDVDGYSTVAGQAVLLPRGDTTPEAVAQAATAGAAAVLVDGPIPAGALGADAPGDVPVLGVPQAVADALRGDLRAGRPVVLSVGDASIGSNPGRGAVAPFSSGGLAFDGTPKPDVSAPGVGLATSAPGTDQDGAPRYVAVSGSSVAAAVAAGAAARLAQARPDLDAAALKAALVQTAVRPGAARGETGPIDVDAAASTEVVVDPPALPLGVPLGPGHHVNLDVTVRNVSRRRLTVTLDPSAGGTGARLTILPDRLVLDPGAAEQVGVFGDVKTLPRAPGALTGGIRVVPDYGAPFRVRWAIAVPVVSRPLVSHVTLSQTTFVPSDANPAVLTVTAGRVDGSAESPQLQPLAELQLDLYAGDRLLGTLARVRELLPGRYAFGLTGRGPRGARLRRGVYSVRLVATSVTGFEDAATIRFHIR